MEWGRLSGGDLLAVVQCHRIEIMVTADRGILYEQSHANQSIALVGLDSN
jgi:hypothetical protein